MSKAEALLTGLKEPGYTYSINPASEPHIVINADKTVTIPEELKRILVQHDHNVETVTFDCPRYWDGHDLSAMIMRIVFKRSDGHREPHPVENLRVDESDPNMIHFDWTISRNTTLVSGTILITVCAKIADAEGVAEREWHTIPNGDIFVNEGMDCSGEEVVEQYPDIIESILVQLDTLQKEFKPYDWNANEGDDGYIKNRTHHVISPRIEILPETSFTSEDLTLDGIGFDLAPFNPMTDADYLITLDSVEYRCTPMSFPMEAASASTFANRMRSASSDQIIVIGNVALINEELANSGEPFILLYVPDFLCGFIVAPDYGESFTLSITQLEKVKKLDNKYLDLDWIPTTKVNDDIYCSDTVAITDGSSWSSYYSGEAIYYGGERNKIPFGRTTEEMTSLAVDGTPIKVKFDGLVHNCRIHFPPSGVDGSIPTIVTEEHYNDIVNGVSEGRSEGPFLIILTNTFVVLTTEIGIHTISIYTERIDYDKLPERYLPNTIPGKNLPEGGVGYSDYEMGEALIPTRKLYNTFLNETVILALDYVPITEGKSYIVHYDGTNYECIATGIPFTDTIPAVALSDGEIDFTEGEHTAKKFIILFIPKEHMDGIGVMLMPLDGLRTEYTAGVFEKAEVIHKIDPKYIPDTGSGKVPYFNLAEMGLGAIGLGAPGDIVADTTELMGAMKCGPVKIGFNYDIDGQGMVVYGTAIVNAMCIEDLGAVQATFMGRTGNNFNIVTLDVTDNHIEMDVRILTL